MRDRVVVVGVSGGIAAYKACELVRRLRDQGATVIAVMTPAACEFVTPLTFQALTGNPVVTTLWGDQKPRFRLPLESARRAGGHVEHVDVAEVADAVVVAPATADLMARMVHGAAPDALTALLLATRAPVLLAPAMDMQMWRAAATQDNVRVLRARGIRMVGPDQGYLASGLSGPGRLAEVPAIVDAVADLLTVRESLKGVRVLVGAGRTEEPLDPVRVLTNRSSGRMGVALAEAARDRGADVTLVAGPMSVDTPWGVTVAPVRTAAEMQQAMSAAAAHADVVLMAAAVADYRPRAASREKPGRASRSMTLELEGESRHPRRAGRAPLARAGAGGLRAGDQPRRGERARQAEVQGRRPDRAERARARHRRRHQPRHAGGREERARVARSEQARRGRLDPGSRARAAAPRGRAAVRARAPRSRARRRRKRAATPRGRRTGRAR